MEKLQLCKRCNSNIAYYICKLCGKAVCANCYDGGFCLDCKRGKTLFKK
ncbi:MAG: hypothetical protein AABW41_03445 [Nanoarchaeota archaeon]